MLQRREGGGGGSLSIARRGVHRPIPILVNLPRQEKNGLQCCKMLHVPLSYRRAVMCFMLLGTVQKAPWVVLWEYSRAFFSFRVSHFFYLLIMGEEANHQ